jgi:membrane protein YqaA with SNARE-associated domain
LKKIFGYLHRMKAWMEGYAEKPHAVWVLFLIAFTESSFFPIPPDVLLIAMAVVAPRKSFKYALVCSVGSVLGGMFGYLIGQQFFDSVGSRIISAYGVQSQYEAVQSLYQENAFWSIAVAGFTPIPYKVFTIAAGAFNISFATLVTASVLSRSARFFLVAALFYFFGARIKTFIDRYFEILTVAFTVLFVLGFVVIRWVV